MTDEFLPHEEMEEVEDEPIKAPFTFKLMIVLTVAYLGWRVVQMIGWVIEWIRS